MNNNIPFTSYVINSPVLQQDLFAESPLVSTHIGTTSYLNAPLQNSLPGVIKDVLTSFTKKTPLGGLIIGWAADKYIKGTTLEQYANAFYQSGSISSDPIAIENPASSIFNFDFQEFPAEY